MKSLGLRVSGFHGFRVSGFQILGLGGGGGVNLEFRVYKVLAFLVLGC